MKLTVPFRTRYNSPIDIIELRDLGNILQLYMNLKELDKYYK